MIFLRLRLLLVAGSRVLSRYPQSLGNRPDQAHAVFEVKCPTERSSNAVKTSPNYKRYVRNMSHLINI